MQMKVRAKSHIFISSFSEEVSAQSFRERKDAKLNLFLKRQTVKKRKCFWTP